jgi:hypothetical protein
VLVVGGYYGEWLSTAEVYDPEIETWTEIPLPLFCHGVGHTASLLSDGTVLLVGGACGSGAPGFLDSTEIYDPVTMTWIATASLPTIREAHTATLLPDDTVLVVGGSMGAPPLIDSGLIYDPEDGAWNLTASLATGRRGHTATLLNDGRVLVVGGRGDTTSYLESAELYQEAVTETPTPTDTPLPPTPTNTPFPPTPTNTPLPPTSTNTPLPPTLIKTPFPLTLIKTPLPPTPTNTPLPPTLTNTPLPPTSTNTPLPPTQTPTSTPLPPTQEGLGQEAFLVLVSLVAIVGLVLAAAGLLLNARSAKE